MPVIDLAACKRVGTPDEQPGDKAKCRTTRELFESLEALIAIRFLPRLPDPPRPPFRIDIFDGDPTPEPSIVGNLLGGELILDALKREHSPNSILGQIQTSGEHIRIVEGLLGDFKEAVGQLEDELRALEEIQG